MSTKTKNAKKSQAVQVKGKKAKKEPVVPVLVEEVVVSESAPKGEPVEKLDNVLTWEEPKIERTDVSDWHVWTTSCGRYRIVRSVPRSANAEPYFFCDSVQEKKLIAKRNSLRGALTMVEGYHKDRFGLSVESTIQGNRDEVIAKAVETELDTLPAKAVVHSHAEPKVETPPTPEQEARLEGIGDVLDFLAARGLTLADLGTRSARTARPATSSGNGRSSTPSVGRPARAGKVLIHGWAPVAIIRRLGQDGWEFQPIRKVLDANGASYLQDSSIRGVLKTVKDGTWSKYGKMADLTVEQAAEFKNQSK